MRIPLLTGLVLVSAWTTHAQSSSSSNQEISSQATSSGIPAADAPTGSSSSVFTFEDFTQGNERIYNESDTSISRVVWLSPPSTSDVQIQLYIRKNIDEVVSTVSWPLPGIQSFGNSSMTVTSSGNDLRITLVLETILTNNGDNHTYFFALRDQDITSPLFGVVKSRQSDTSGFDKEGLTDFNPATIQSVSSSTSPAGSPKTTSNNASGVIASSSGSKASGGGLATGAIAGIAVGAAVVLIIIIAAIWFILRHRRQRARSHPADAATPLAAGYGGVAAAAVSRDFMAEKEAGAVVAESPQSRTYTDQLDPQHSAILSRTAVTAGPIAGPANASYTESGHQAYDDVGRALTDHQPPHASASSGRGLDSPVPEIGVTRHLVDDDMTADEIARLEEEERELDRQIQEAGRRRR